MNDNCFLCGKIQTGWSQDSLKLLLEGFKLCPKHREFCENLIIKPKDEQKGPDVQTDIGY